MEAKDNLKQLLQFFLNFDEDSLNKITDCFHTKVVKKNTVLLSEGEVAKSFYFINKGCIRTYFITKQGQERTRYLMIEPSIGTALTSFISQKPSFEFIDAVEKTELLVINHHDFYQLVDTVPQWKDFYLKMMEMAYAFQNRKIEELVTLSAKERYELLLKENPKAVLRLSNKVIASYLVIKQETLSRLKSK